MGRCKYYDAKFDCCGLDSSPCGAYPHIVPCNKCERFKPITNYDRIRGMNVKQLAEFICGIYDTEEDNAKFINGTIIPCYNEDDIADWLNSEVEE